MKFISKERLKKEQQAKIKELEEEIELMRRIVHPNCIQLIEGRLRHPIVRAHTQMWSDTGHTLVVFVTSLHRHGRFRSSRRNARRPCFAKAMHRHFAGLKCATEPLLPPYLSRSLRGKQQDQHRDGARRRFSRPSPLSLPLSLCPRSRSTFTDASTQFSACERMSLLIHQKRQAA